jgi:hypothetical protein
MFFCTSHESVLFSRAVSHFTESISMAAIPQRLKSRPGDEEDPRRGSESRTEDVPASTLEFDDHAGEIPIFCAGGCGEVLGFFKQGESIPTHRCPACQAAEAEKASRVSGEATPADTDELAELRSPPPNLRAVHIFQVLAVALISAGSVCIALGRPLGIYLAAIGTLAWVSVAVVRRRMRQ